MRITPPTKLKALMMCFLALLVFTSGFYVYRWASAKPKCNCMYPNTKQYGVIGQGGTCRIVDCELKEARKQPDAPR